MTFNPNLPQTEEQQANLRQLAGYLLSDGLVAQFAMDIICQHELWNTEAEYCGTVGCAMGHGPYAGIKKESHESWYQYASRVFGTTEDKRTSGGRWMFNGEWVITDNTPQGAARRILWYLEHGVPDDAVEQMEGHSPLSYVVPAAR